MVQKYNTGSNTSSIDVGGSSTQLSDYFYRRKALIEARRNQYFTPLSSTVNQPKNYGKTLKQYLYIPLLDDRNVNDEGIDANGVTAAEGKWVVEFANASYAVPTGTGTAEGPNGEDDTDFTGLNGTGGVPASFFVVDTSGGASAHTVVIASSSITGLTKTQAQTLSANALASYWDPKAYTLATGNLYGSSRDVGSIPNRMPRLGETGGKVNRVSFTRKTIEGSLEHYGFYTEYTRESLEFDSDAELFTHINQEMLVGATDIAEDLLQIDLINAAGTTVYGGSATKMSDVKEESEVSYSDLVKASMDLDKTHTPMRTTVITGSRNVDTRVIPGARVMFSGPEMVPNFMRMKLYDNSTIAFIGIEQYAAAGSVLNGEVGSVGKFRIVVDPEMVYWEGGGAKTANTETGVTSDGDASTTHHTSQHDNGDYYYDVFPLLVVGDQSFQTITFQATANDANFRIYHKAPGPDTVDRNDPYGTTGLMSIQWYYGFLPLRPERIYLIKTVAKLA